MAGADDFDPHSSARLSRGAGLRNTVGVWT